MMTFNVIDVETANADQESICQIGIIHVKDGQIIDKWQTLINPEDWFDGFNVQIHGIDEDDVADAPTLPEVREELRTRLRGSVLVSHTAFDRVAFERAMVKYDLEQLQVTWLDSAKIARRAWPDKCAYRGYGIKNIAEHLKISFKHHDALEDARAAAEIVLCACKETGKDIDEWMKRVNQPIYRKKSYSVQQEGNKEGPLHGETLVFTGSLGIPREKAAKIAADAGCQIKDNVTKDTTIVVVGLQDPSAIGNYEKSSKHRKAETLIKKGMEIRILSEKDFFELIKIEPPQPKQPKQQKQENAIEKLFREKEEEQQRKWDNGNKIKAITEHQPIIEELLVSIHQYVKSIVKKNCEVIRDKDGEDFYEIGDGVVSFKPSKTRAKKIIISSPHELAKWELNLEKKNLSFYGLENYFLEGEDWLSFKPSEQQKWKFYNENNEPSPSQFEANLVDTKT